jgi:choloylglycine hydrolase
MVNVTEIPGLSVSLWLQFILDNFANVEEAVTYIENYPFQILPCIVDATGKISEVHMMIEDGGGDTPIRFSSMPMEKGELRYTTVKSTMS